MKTAVLISNGSLQMEDRPPCSPQSGECRIRIAAAGVCASDVWRGFENGAYGYPLVMGHEIAGYVDAVGTEAKFETLIGMDYCRCNNSLYVIDQANKQIRVVDVATAACLLPAHDTGNLGRGPSIAWRTPVDDLWVL